MSGNSQQQLLLQVMQGLAAQGLATAGSMTPLMQVLTSTSQTTNAIPSTSGTPITPIKRSAETNVFDLRESIQSSSGSSATSSSSDSKGGSSSKKSKPDKHPASQLKVDQLKVCLRYKEIGFHSSAKKEVLLKLMSEHFSEKEINDIMDGKEKKLQEFKDATSKSGKGGDTSSSQMPDNVRKCCLEYRAQFDAKFQSMGHGNGDRKNDIWVLVVEKTKEDLPNEEWLQRFTDSELREKFKNKFDSAKGYAKTYWFNCDKSGEENIQVPGPITGVPCFLTWSKSMHDINLAGRLTDGRGPDSNDTRGMPRDRRTSAQKRQAAIDERDQTRYEAQSQRDAEIINILKNINTWSDTSAVAESDPNAWKRCLLKFKHDTREEIAEHKKLWSGLHCLVRTGKADPGAIEHIQDTMVCYMAGDLPLESVILELSEYVEYVP